MNFVSYYNNKNFVVISTPRRMEQFRSFLDYLLINANTVKKD
jgi:hypothetical protein